MARHFRRANLGVSCRRLRRRRRFPETPASLSVVGLRVGIAVVMAVSLCVLALGAGVIAQAAGARANVAVPRGKTAAVGGNWSVKVNTAAPGVWVVSGNVLASPSGAEFVVGITARWTGGGTGDVTTLLKRMWLHAGGANSSSDYSADKGNGSVFGCALKRTPKDWRGINSIHRGKVPSGSSLTGRVCFQVDPGSSVSFRLRVLDPSCPSTPLQGTSCSKYVLFNLK
jgi:hypothetical protein